MSNTRRISKELEIFLKSKECQKNHIHLLAKDDNLLDLRGLVFGPVDTPFEGCPLYFSIQPLDYPIHPPKIKFLTPYSQDCRIHPNLYADGKVCLSILGTWGQNDWSPFLTFEKILLTIQGLCDNNPISHEPSFSMMKDTDHKAIEYRIRSRWLALQSTFMMLENNILPSPFQTIFKEYVKEHSYIYEKSITLLEPYHRKNISTIHGSSLIDVELLKNSYVKFLKSLESKE